MPRELSPREADQRKKFRRGVWILIVIGLILGSIFAFYFRAYFRTVPLDPQSLCPTDRPPSAQIVLLVDTTDAYSEIQKAAALKALREIQADVPKYARFSVFELGMEESAQLSPRVSLCNPGSGEDASRWDTRPKTLRKQWEDGFKQPVEALMANLLAATPATQSPILSQIQAISVVGFESVPGERRLYILSDLLQNDSAYSHYGTGAPPAFEDFQAKGHLNRYRANLDDVSVYLFYVRREGMGSVQGRRHSLFWEKYFSAIGAKVKSSSPLTG